MERIPIADEVPSPDEVDYRLLPTPLVRVVNRVARLQRLVELDAPTVILENELRLLGESTIGLVVWVDTNAVQPTRDLIHQHAEAHRLTELQEHMRAQHADFSTEAVAFATLAELEALHEKWHAIRLQNHNVTVWTESDQEMLDMLDEEDPG